jgi:hypothetical protein
MDLLRDRLGRVAHLAKQLPIVSPLQTGEANGLLALLASAEVKLDIAQQGAASGADRLVLGLFAFRRSRRNLIGSDVGLEYFRAAKMASRLNASCEGGGGGDQEVMSALRAIHWVTSFSKPITRANNRELRHLRQSLPQSPCPKA